MELDFNSEVIEKILLKKALVDQKWLGILSNTYDPRWFKSKDVSTVIQLAIKFFRKYNTLPSSQVVNALIGKYIEKYPGAIDKSQVNQLLAEVSTFDLNTNEDILNNNLKEFIRKNAFKFAIEDNIDAVSGKNFNDNYDGIVEKCLEKFDKVQKITFSDTDLGLNYFDAQAMDKHWDYIRNPDAKIKTGWQSLDSYTNGGFLKDGRSLYLIMAQAGLGKSVFLSNMAVNFLKQNLKVVVISLEMSEDVYACRFDAHISKKNINLPTKILL